MRPYRISLMLSLLLVLSLHGVTINAQQSQLNANSTQQNETICSAENCRLPLCKCANTKTPGNINLNEVPMMIMLTFNGVVRQEHSAYLQRILNPIYRNPNGCPVQATFYVSNEDNNHKTDYCLVQKLFNNNNEIGVGAIKYLCPYTDCMSLGIRFAEWGEDMADKQIYEQKKNLVRKGQINHSFLRGFRLPMLDQNGKIHHKILKKYAFNYDSSVIVRPEDIKRFNGQRMWPHTTEFPANYTCPNCDDKLKTCHAYEIHNCTTKSIWVVPMHYLDAEDKYPCPSLISTESFTNRFSTHKCRAAKDLTQPILEQILLNNFKRHYDTNKAPFVVNIETSWLQRYGDILTGALVNFISNMTNENNYGAKYDDVYFVTVEKALEWIQYPTKLDVVASKWLWNCDGVSFDYNQDCSLNDQLVKNKELEEIKKANKTSALLDLQAEDLFRNGVLTTCVVFFTLSIIFIMIYDRLH